MIISGTDELDNSQMLMLRKKLQDYKEETRTLKSAVQRLNVELSQFQAKYRRPSNKVLWNEI